MARVETSIKGVLEQDGLIRIWTSPVPWYKRKFLQKSSIVKPHEIRLHRQSYSSALSRHRVQIKSPKLSIKKTYRKIRQCPNF